MSKSKGNIYYIETLLGQGYEIHEIRFFLIYGHYRQKLNYSKDKMDSVVDKLKRFRGMVHNIYNKAGKRDYPDERIFHRLKQVFVEKMDNDLDVKGSFDELYKILSGINIDILEHKEASKIIKSLKEIDEVLKVIF